MPGDRTLARRERMMRDFIVGFIAGVVGSMVTQLLMYLGGWRPIK